jgi:hypothetical protein
MLPMSCQATMAGMTFAQARPVRGRPCSRTTSGPLPPTAAAGQAGRALGSPPLATMTVPLR